MNVPDLFDEILIVAGAIILIGAFIAFRKTRFFIAKCRTTEGTIVDVVKEESDDGVWFFWVVEFNTSAVSKQRIRGAHGHQEPPTIGTVLSITFDGDNPKNAWVTGTAAPWIVPWFVAIVGIACVIGGLAIRANW